MGRRSKIEISMDILDAAKEGLSSTNLAYRVHLSYRQFKNYSDNLVEKELLKFDGEKLYETTDKGRLLLRHWKELRRKV